MKFQVNGTNQTGPDRTCKACNCDRRSGVYQFIAASYEEAVKCCFNGVLREHFHADVTTLKEISNG